jgi:neurofibromin 1
MAVLIRFCLMLSFHNHLHLEQFLPELFHIISMVASAGSNFVRVSVYNMFINIVHSLCTSFVLKTEQLSSLEQMLLEFEQPRIRLLFGVRSPEAFDIQPQDAAVEISLSSLETVVNCLIDVIFSGAVAPGMFSYL